MKAAFQISDRSQCVVEDVADGYVRVHGSNLPMIWNHLQRMFNGMNANPGMASTQPANANPQPTTKRRPLSQAHRRKIAATMARKKAEAAKAAASKAKPKVKSAGAAE